MNRRWKAVAIGAITAAAGIGVGTFGAEIALAHATVVTGTSACQTDGTYTVTWKVANDFNSIEDVTYVSRTGGGTLTGLPVTIAASPGTPYKYATVTQSGISGAATSASLTVKGSWHDGYSQNNTGSVTLAGTCNKVTGAAPTYTEPTCANNTASVVYTPVAHVTYTTSPAAAPGVTVTVTAHADAGYVLAGTTQWTHQFNLSPTNCVLPVAPTVVVKTECSVADTFNAGPTTGVLYSTDGINYFSTVTGNLNAGGNVGVVTAKADNGFVLAPGAQTSFDLTGTVIETCSTPVAPAVAVKTACGVNDTFTAGPTTGVLYSTDGINDAASVSGTLNAGSNVGVVKAKAANGYALTAGSPTSFDLTGSVIEKCGDAEPPTVVTTADCGVKDTFSAGPTTGVLYSTDGVTFTPTVTGSLDAGQVVTITAGPDAANGYNFPTETFPVTGGPVEVCPTTVTPVAPNIVTPPCGEPATFTTTVTGVVYSPTSGTLTPGADTVITVAPAAGHVLAAGAPTSYTLTGPAIAPCEEEPTTTIAQVSVEPPAPTTTTVVVAPPAPEAPPLGLPETGSSNTVELLLGGFLLVTGASLLGLVRRRAVKVKG